MSPEQIKQLIDKIRYNYFNLTKKEHEQIKQYNLIKHMSFN